MSDRIAPARLSDLLAENERLRSRIAAQDKLIEEFGAHVASLGAPAAEYAVATWRDDNKLGLVDYPTMGARYTLARAQRGCRDYTEMYSDRSYFPVRRAVYSTEWSPFASSAEEAAQLRQEAADNE